MRDAERARARLFVAVELEEALREQVAAVSGRLASALQADAGTASVRWVAPRNLHVTLRFIGETPRGELPVIGSVVSEPYDEAPFRLALGGAGAFPPSGSVRVVWLDLSAGVPELTRLRGTLERRLRAAGVEVDERPFRPHLTLGRLRRPCGGAAGRAIRERLAQLAPIGDALVDRVALVESRLGPAGPTYVVRAHGPLVASR